MDNEIFVFGSNLAGIHGAGAAKYARTHWGAKWGVGVGRTGNAYAIPTKDEHIQTLSLDRIEVHAKNFIQYARDNPDLVFLVTKFGCGLAGYSSEDIAPMMIQAPPNCLLPYFWQEFGYWADGSRQWRKAWA